LERWFSPGWLADESAHPQLIYARECLLRMNPSAFADAWRAMADHDVADQLGRIKAPVTCLAGSEDAASPVSARAAMREMLPNSRLVVLPGPHMIQLENPDAFSEAIRDHLAWVAAQLQPTQG
jgi:3-oxoadipate enol-lactonase